MSEEFNSENVVYEDVGRIMGLSAYELAVRNGFTGTEAQWIASLKGERGYGISNIERTDTDGLTDTYTITLEDDSTFTLTVENGKGIESVTKTTQGLVDTYRIDYNDDTYYTFSVSNGSSIDAITAGTASTVNGNTVTPVTVMLTDGTTRTFNITAANGISPTIEVTEQANGYDVSITDVDGEKDTIHLRNYDDSALKADIYSTVSAEYSTTADGWKLLSNGRSQADENYKLVKYKVEAGRAYTVTATGAWQFQNVASVPTASSNMLGSQYTGNGTATAPTNANHLIISVPETETPTVMVARPKSDINADTINKIKEVKKDSVFVVTADKAETVETINRKTLDYKTTTTDDFPYIGELNSDGTINDSKTNVITSCYIPLSDVKHVYREGNTSIRLLIACYYDENFNFLSSTASAVKSAETKDGYTGVFFDINQNAAYMRFSAESSRASYHQFYVVTEHKKNYTLNGDLHAANLQEKLVAGDFVTINPTTNEIDVDVDALMDALPIAEEASF